MTKCPKCGSNQAYLGFSTFECPTVGCANYTTKQALAIHQPRSPEVWSDKATLKPLSYGGVATTIPTVAAGTKWHPNDLSLTLPLYSTSFDTVLKAAYPQKSIETWVKPFGEPYKGMYPEGPPVRWYKDGSTVYKDGAYWVVKDAQGVVNYVKAYTEPPVMSATNGELDTYLGRTERENMQAAMNTIKYTYMNPVHYDQLKKDFGEAPEEWAAKKSVEEEKKPNILGNSTLMFRIKDLVRAVGDMPDGGAFGWEHLRSCVLAEVEIQLNAAEDEGWDE